jgi:hypothetical protein
MAEPAHRYKLIDYIISGANIEVAKPVPPQLSPLPKLDVARQL